VATVFFDTSALVKLYVPETGSEAARAVFEPAGNVLIARVTPVEVGSALARKRREGRLSELEVAALWRTFCADVAAVYGLLTLGNEVYETAERLVLSYPLRAFDAIQVASALVAAGPLDHGRSELEFCTADIQQGNAAASEGLPVQMVRSD
jgi:predicted nucleic acid-binding protein